MAGNALKDRWPHLLLVAIVGATTMAALVWLRDATPVAIPAPMTEEAATEPSGMRFLPAAEMGDADAQFNLALMYDLGKGVESDPQEAARWYRLAADQGHVRAQRNLAYLYDAGRGVPQDDTLAAEWNRKAADQGDPGAQNNLATMYYLGRGVPQSHEMALNWFREAARQGDPQAQYNLGKLYQHGKGAEEDHFLAYFWCHIAASKLEAPGDRASAITCRDRSAVRLDEERRAKAQAHGDAWKAGADEPSRE